MEQRFRLQGGENSVMFHFIRLCELQPDSAIPRIKEHLAAAYQRLRAHDGHFLGPNLKVAEAISAGCEFLLSKYPELSEEHKRLVVGAIRYFVIHLDATPDTKPVVGLDDDVLVLNHVIEKIGLEYPFIDVDDYS